MENQNQTYVAKLFYDIAKELKRPPNSVEQYIQAFHDEWLDTKESLQQLTDAQFEKFKLPMRLVQLIKQKISDPEIQSQQIQQKQIDNSKQMQIEEGKQQQSANNKEVTIESEKPRQSQQKQEKQEENQMIIGDKQEEKKDPEDELLLTIRKKAITNDKILAVFQTLSKIFANIIQCPDKDDFRKIKLASKSFSENVGIYPETFELLTMCKFQKNQERIFIEKQDVNKQHFEAILTKLSKYIENALTSNFNPYQATYFGSGGISNADLAKNEGFISFYDLLEQLKKQRDQLMSIPLKDREAKYYQIQKKEIKSDEDKQQELNSVENYNLEVTNQEEVKPINDDLMKKQIQQFQESLEEQHFSSKRKQEYEKMINAPIFQETKLKIKFPCNFLLEVKFSPKETIKSLIDYIESLLVDKKKNWYIYMTPPVVKMTNKYYMQTFLDLDCVPAAVFYFSYFDDNSNKQQVELNLNQK